MYCYYYYYYLFYAGCTAYISTKAVAVGSIPTVIALVLAISHRQLLNYLYVVCVEYCFQRVGFAGYVSFLCLS